MKSRFTLIVIICSIFAFSCNKEDEKLDTKPFSIPQDTSSQSTAAVFVVNEGNFQWGNASVSLYDVKNKLVEEDVFKKVNARPLGDVAQSLEYFNGKFYLTVNNSQKIEILNTNTFQATGVISSLHSPRYFKGITSSKAFVSNIWSNSISVIDLISNTIIKNIPCKGWTEEMLLFKEKCFVSNMFSEYIYVINTISEQLEDSIKVGYASSSLQLDKNGKLWVLCSGDQQKGFKGGIYKIDPDVKQVELALVFPNAGDDPKKLRINNTRDTLYYLNKGVYKMSITDFQLPANAFISPQVNFYGLGIDPKSGEIYVSDAIDFVQRGTVYHYTPSGTLINSFKAGIIPGEFYFK
jgi:DNA-binding beta-propeller fold protein YncE